MYTMPYLLHYSGALVHTLGVLRMLDSTEPHSKPDLQTVLNRYYLTSSVFTNTHTPQQPFLKQMQSNPSDKSIEIIAI